MIAMISRAGRRSEASLSRCPPPAMPGCIDAVREKDRGDRIGLERTRKEDRLLSPDVELFIIKTIGLLIVSAFFLGLGWSASFASDRKGVLVTWLLALGFAALVSFRLSAPSGDDVDVPALPGVPMERTLPQVIVPTLIGLGAGSYVSERRRRRQ